MVSCRLFVVVCCSLLAFVGVGCWLIGCCLFMCVVVRCDVLLCVAICFLSFWCMSMFVSCCCLLVVV